LLTLLEQAGYLCKIVCDSFRMHSHHTGYCRNWVKETWVLFALFYAS